MFVILAGSQAPVRLAAVPRELGLEPQRVELELHLAAQPGRLERVLDELVDLPEARVVEVEAGEAQERHGAAAGVPDPLGDRAHGLELAELLVGAPGEAEDLLAALVGAEAGLVLVRAEELERATEEAERVAVRVDGQRSVGGVEVGAGGGRALAGLLEVAGDAAGADGTPSV